MDSYFKLIFVLIITVPAFTLLLFLLVAGLRVLTQPSVLGFISADLRAIRERDPAAEGWLACMFYPGWWALVIHRLVSNTLYNWHMRTLARLFNFLARFLTGTDIHPGAT